MPFTLQLDRRPTKDQTPRPSKRPAKTRDFSARCLGFMAGTETLAGHVVPLWIALCETRLALEPFVANLRSGWTAKSGRFNYVFPKSAGFRWSTHEITRGANAHIGSAPPVAITIAYRPAFFDLEPRQDLDATSLSTSSSTSTIQFVLAPPTAWVDREALALAPLLGTDAPAAKEAARAAHFAAYLDRRTPLPLLADLRFHLALFRAAKAQNLISSCEFGPSALWGQGLDICGIADPLRFRSTPEDLAQLITEETESFAKRERLHGSPRIPRSRGLFPDTLSTPIQHCFDFAVA